MTDEPNTTPDEPGTVTEQAGELTAQPVRPDAWLPTVSVVIPAFRCAELIGDCLAAVAAQAYPGRLDVTVALAHSEDGTDEKLAEALRRLASTAPELAVQVIDNPGGSTPAGLNAAIARSAGEVVVRIDAQSRIPPDYIGRAVRTMARTGAVNVGGVQHPTPSPGSASSGAVGTAAAIAAALSSPFGGGPAAYRQGRREGPADTVYLGVFKRDALEAVGGFDESLMRNQDYELNWRLRRAGCTVWLDPGLVVDYIPRATHRDLAVQYFHYGSWKRTMLLRNPGSLRPRQLAPPALLSALAVSAAALALRRLAGAAVPLLYATACAHAVRKLRHELPAARDRLQAGLACIVIHLSWAAGFLFGRSRRSHRPRRR